MKLYNSLSGKLEEFKPIRAGEVSLYTCGPTVYDYAHIGNLRAYVFIDTLRRALEANKFNVKHVMNITDVGHLVSDEDEGEDKLEKGAKREGKSVWEVAKYYTEGFKSDVKQLNILEPNGYKGNNDNYARATDFIDEQIEIVKLLLDKGVAYQTDQAIYFNVTKLTSYGELTGQKLSDKEVAARSEVVTDKSKKHPQDFAVWFFTIGRFADHEMRWQSPWGEGFPGWHLECSAIIHATLSDQIDIHTGAVDLIGTHHTNEMAQTEAAYGNKLANYWVHNEHLLVDNQRMAKSLGNFYTLSDVIEKGYDPLALRLLFLQAHYRSQMNFTWEALQAVQAFLRRLQAWADLKHQPNLGHKKDAGRNYDDALKSVLQSLSDDLNTAQALGVISRLATQSETEGVDIAKLQPILKKIDDVLGLDLANREDISSQAKEIIERREQARKNKNWSAADALRTELVKQGIEINDTPHGPVWAKS
ncbi:MAG TPA: cysteine--tRNA ligase [Candidatus Saccharimonadales bacterium]|nr:cysteine--tRNA ligase [Candidatus Saccharimonadales bacterium]